MTVCRFFEIISAEVQVPTMQTTLSKMALTPTGQTDTGVKTRSAKVGGAVRTVHAVKQAHARAVPVMSKEQIALFSGIETSPQFTAEAVYAAFAGISQST
jgi:hypothetical protein